MALVHCQLGGVSPSACRSQPSPDRPVGACDARRYPSRASGSILEGFEETFMGRILKSMVLAVALGFLTSQVILYKTRR